MRGQTLLFRLTTVLVVASALAACRPVDDLRARLQLKEGNLDYLAGDYEAAIEHYQQALRYRSNHPDAHLNSGYSLMAMMRAETDSAKRCALADRAAVTFNGLLDPEYHDVLGQKRFPNSERIEQYVLTLLLDSHQQQRAVALLEKRLQNDPADISSMLMISNLCAELGQMREAITWRERCVETQPDRPESHYSMAVFAWDASYHNQIDDPVLRDNLVQRGLDALDRALELKPDYFEALSYQSMLYQEKARYAPKAKERLAFEKLADGSKSLAEALWRSTTQQPSGLTLPRATTHSDDTKN